MIKEFVTRWEENKSKARKAFSEKHPDEYVDIVREVVKALETDEYAELAPDPNRIHIIDDGGYQGTLLFIIAEKGYQPSKYYSVFVSYGSCSGCDTLQGITEYSDDPPTDSQVEQYMTLALHIVQGLKVLGEE